MRFLALTYTLLIMQTCAQESQFIAADLAGEYRLIAFQGQAIGDLQSLHRAFHRPMHIHEDGSVWGHGGCNGGSLQIDPTLTYWQPVRPLRATQRFCPPAEDDPVPEAAYFNLLSGTYDWDLKDGLLSLWPQGVSSDTPSALFAIQPS